jgi:quinol monooxygenase YgiN
MRRSGFLLSVLGFLLLAPGLTAQDTAQPERVYAAYFQVSYSDLEEWIGLWNEVTAPILQELVDEGMLVGYGAQTHNTGGNFNFRQAMQGAAFTNFDAVWGALFERIEERNPAALERIMGMMQLHDDEIWNIDSMEVEGAENWKYFYDTMFQVNYDEMEAFAEMFQETFGETLAQARADGLLAGWVTESHNTGGQYNWKVIMLFDEWDDIDDLQARFFEAAPLSHPFWGMFNSHKDELWEALPSGM